MSKLDELIKQAISLLAGAHGLLMTPHTQEEAKTLCLEIEALFRAWAEYRTVAPPMDDELFKEWWV